MTTEGPELGECDDEKEPHPFNTEADGSRSALCSHWRPLSSAPEGPEMPEGPADEFDGERQSMKEAFNREYEWRMLLNE